MTDSSVGQRNGTWQRLLKVMQAAADEAGLVDWDGAALDATHIKAQRSAVGAAAEEAAGAARLASAETEEVIRQGIMSVDTLGLA